MLGSSRPSHKDVPINKSDKNKFHKLTNQIKYFKTTQGASSFKSWSLMVTA
jgi:hypothetical protein